MIVDPDFLDHWRTQMLADLLDGDPLAPVYIIRLWSHCQNRRDTKFSPMPAAGLKAICRYQGDADQLEAAMVEAGFIERNGDEISVPKWADYNSQLMANWENGRRGGRPKKTHSKPIGNPSGTHPEPKSAKPENGVTSREPSREEKSREDEKGREEVCPTSADANAEPAPVKVMEVPCVHADEKQRLWPVMSDKVAQWQETYPAVDVMTELRKLLQWIRDNPRRKKTREGMPAFINNWMKREQDSGRPSVRGQPAGRQPPNKMAGAAEFLASAGDRQRRIGGFDAE